MEDVEREWIEDAQRMHRECMEKNIEEVQYRKYRESIEKV